MPNQTAQDKQWEAESALRTLQRAEEIKVDKGLMKRVQKEGIKQEKALKKAIVVTKKVTGSKPAPRARSKKR